MTPDVRVRMGALWVGTRRIPCTLGKSGRTHAKSEGDGATPATTLTITACLYRPDRVQRPAPWAMAIRPNDGWSDEPTDPDYNHLIRRPHAPSHERLWRADPLYDVVLCTDWNWPDAVPGAGSAIFVHRWRRPGFPTEGCIAMAPENLTWFAQFATPGTKIDIR